MSLRYKVKAHDYNKDGSLSRKTTLLAEFTFEQDAEHYKLLMNKTYPAWKVFTIDSEWIVSTYSPFLDTYLTMNRFKGRKKK